MNVTIQNYRGLSSATLDISKICLLAGLNESGKTSASQALAAALTGDPVPIPGVAKTQAGLLVRSGTANGSVELTTEAGTTKIQWPSAKVKTEGAPPFASHFATGLHSIVTMDEKARVKTLTEYLKAIPTRTDLDAQLASMKLPVAVLDQLWQLIEVQGWDNAHSQIKEKGARLKGQWQQAAGEQYGSKKADSWIPEGYDNELMGQSEATLTAFCTDARDALEAAIASEAVDDSKRGDLEAQAALKPARQEAVTAAKNQTADPALSEQLKQAQAFIADISKKRDVLNAELAALPSATQTTGMPCPDCGTVLQLSGKTLAIAAVISPEEITARAEAIATKQGAIDATNDAISKHMTAVSTIQATIREQQTARDNAITDALRLLGESATAEKELAKPLPPASDISVDDCRTTMARAETRLKAFTRKLEADRLHVSIGNNAELLAKISPEGIRGDVLAKALKGFNESLAPITKAAGWRPVVLESDFMPTYGGTIYLLLSESAKFRVRTVLLLGMALIDKSQAVIIDAADILDRGGRNGLFKALKVAGLPALVAMTIDAYVNKPGEDFPVSHNVPKLGALGASYWINSDAVAEQV
jgi:hypothetical protein